MDVWVGGGREESVVNLNAQAAKAVDSANSNSLQESRVRQNSEIVLNVWFNRNLPLSFTPLLRGFCRDIASLAFQISPRDVFCAVTYIPQYVGYLQKERERESKPRRPPGRNILHVSHLKSKFDIPPAFIREYQ